jgi:hypothetical protein
MLKSDFIFLPRSAYWIIGTLCFRKSSGLCEHSRNILVKMSFDYAQDENNYFDLKVNIY